MKYLVILLALAMAVPCYGRSRKSQEKIDARHSQAVEAARANLLNARADAVRQRAHARERHSRQVSQFNQQTITQRAHEQGVRNQIERERRMERKFDGLVGY
jgi:3-dehydroquinate dehydratase